MTLEEIVLPVHPFTGLTAIGFRVDGRPIWPVLGGAPDDDDKPDDDDDDADDDKKLGPKGERALAAEKERRKTEADKRRSAEKERDEARAELAKLKKKPAGDKDDDAPDAAAIQAAAKKDADAKANARILRSEIRSIATGKLSDPKDALVYLAGDITAGKFEVDDDGNVDEDEIAAAIDDLLKKKPYLAAQGGKRFQGGGDGGARNGGSKKSQLTKEDMKKMTPEAIVTAKDAGRFDELLGIKT